jgi:hypothetical protein
MADRALSSRPGVVSAGGAGRPARCDGLGLDQGQDRVQGDGRRPWVALQLGQQQAAWPGGTPIWAAWRDAVRPAEISDPDEREPEQ